MTKAVIYARYSCENQREESIEGQLRECLAFAKSKGYEVIDKYIDRAISAKTDDRPSFQQMIHDGVDHKFDVVIVWKMDRFSRNRLNALQYKSILKKAKVKLISATEAISDGPEGILLESVLDGMAEYYSADLAQKVKRGMTENILEGKYNGGPVPFGYKVVNQYYQINEQEAPIVKEIFKQYANTGMSANQLTKYLASKGMFYKNGKSIDSGTLYGIIGNRKYIGELSIDGTVNKNAVPRLVSDELFIRANDKKSKFHKHSASFKSKIGYMLSCKAFCGKCGSLMVGDSTKRYGKTYNYYKCSKAKKKQCDCHGVRYDILENAVIKGTAEFLKSQVVLSSLVDELYNKQSESSPMLNSLNLQLEAINKKIKNIVGLVTEGDDFGEFKEQYKKLVYDKKNLTLQIEDINRKLVILSKDEIATLLKKFFTFNIDKKEDKDRLVSQFINAVYVNEDKSVDIVFNVFNRSQPLTKEELMALSRKKVDKEFYREVLCGNGFYGISLRPTLIRFTTTSRKKVQNVYTNGTNQYYKSLNEINDLLIGLEPVSLRLGQMKKKPDVFVLNNI